MTLETIAYYGCERSGELDLWNCDRTLTYARKYGPTIDRACCPDFTPYLETPDVFPAGPDEITALSTFLVIENTAVTTAASFSGSFTVVAGNNRRLLVSIGLEAVFVSGVHVDTVTLNGVGLTRIVRIGANEGSWDLVELWYLDEVDMPTDGAHTLVVTTTMPGTTILGLAVHCTMLQNINPIPPVPAAFATDTTTTLFSLDVPASTGGWVIGAIIGGSPSGVFTPTAPAIANVEGPYGTSSHNVFRMSLVHIRYPTAGVNTIDWSSSPSQPLHAVAGCYMARALSTVRYNDPATDDAWWYDSTRPESVGFFGFEAVKVSGLYASTVKRDVTNRTTDCGTRGMYGPQIDNGYTITVEGYLHGATCCAVRYGYLALKSLLRGCCKSKKCTGTRLRILTSLPDESTHGCDDALPAETTSPWRTITNVAVMDEPEIVGRSGPSCGCGCAPVTAVRFVLHADPGQYLPPVDVLGHTLITLNATTCTLSLSCVPDFVNALIDPTCEAPIVGRPPDVVVPCFCRPMVFSQKSVYVTIPSTMFPSQLEATIKAGSTALRNFTVKVWKVLSWQPTFDSTVYNDDNICAGFSIAYLPALSTWRQTACDGVTVQLASGSIVRGDSTLLSVSGLPGSPCITLPCGDIIVSIESDSANTAANASISLTRREVEP